MLGFIVRRLLSSLLVIGLASFVVFAVFYLGPSNPAQPVCDGAGGRCTAERLAAIEKQMGLDKPVIERLREFMGGVVNGREIDFGASTYDCTRPCLGVSYGTRNEVTDELKERIVPTVLIAIGGSIVFLTVGVGIGIAAASRRGSAGDRFLVSGSLLVSLDPLLPLVPARLDLPDLADRHLPRHRVLPDHGGPTQTGSAACCCRGWCWAWPTSTAVRAVHPRSDGRDPGRGLHPHRHGQGPDPSGW